MINVKIINCLCKLALFCICYKEFEYCYAGAKVDKSANITNFGRPCVHWDMNSKA